LKPALRLADVLLAVAVVVTVVVVQDDAGGLEGAALWRLGQLDVLFL